MGVEGSDNQYVCTAILRIKKKKRFVVNYFLPVLLYAHRASESEMCIIQLDHVTCTVFKNVLGLECHINIIAN